jgi:hypothetical protein
MRSRTELMFQVVSVNDPVTRGLRSS